MKLFEIHTSDIMTQGIAPMPNEKDPTKVCRKKSPREKLPNDSNLKE